MSKHVAILLLLINLFWSVALYFEPTHTTIYNYLYNFAYGINFLLISVFCANLLRKFPKYKAGSLFFSLASFLFFVAQLVWIYYNVILQNEVPYPSLADFFWVSFYPLMSIGFVLLLKKLKYSINLWMAIELIMISGVIFLLISSFLSLHTSQSGLPILTQILNYLYPYADSLLITLSIFALRSHAGKLQTELLFFIFGFIILAISDTLFSYQTTLESYWNGNIVDASYAISGFFLFMAVIGLPKLFQNNDVLTDDSANS